MVKPSNFFPVGDITFAHFSDSPFHNKPRYTGARAQGVRYEKKVQKHLLEMYEGLYLPSQWIRFHADGRLRYCQPDGILFQPKEGKIIIVEVKYQHTPDAWWQVRHLYQPVLEKIFPPHLWTYEACEIVKWFDPATAFPEKIFMAPEVHLPSKFFKVHICRP